MIEDKVITGQEFGPAGLKVVQDFRRHEGFEILVIGTNVDRMFGTFKIMTPVLEAFDNGEHFAIVDIIVAFRRGTLPGDQPELRMVPSLLRGARIVGNQTGSNLLKSELPSSPQCR